MSKKVTPAIRWLRKHGVDFEVCPYEYMEKGGTAASSAALGVPEHQVIKTLVFEDESKKPLIVLMHGDKSVSAKALARVIGVKRVGPCSPQTAQKHSGYQVGGTSPFGTRKAMPVYVESSILGLERIWINGGGRGLLVSLEPSVLAGALAGVAVSVAQ